MSKAKPKMTKDTVPEGFSMKLALVDAIPVIFFGIDFLLIGRLFGSVLFIIGALLCLVAGAAKVLWKIIVVLKKKNIWALFIQMRILMPIGFGMMVLALIVNASRLSFPAILGGICSFPAVIFFALGVIGMAMMIVFAKKLDSSDLRSNWIEQLTNGAAQICFFIGLVILSV